MIGGSNGFLRTMTASRTPPDIKTFTLLLETLNPTLEAEQELIQSMKNNKVKLDLDFCNLLIKKRAMHSRFEDAKKAMRLIKERKFKPNVVTFGVLALACKDFEDAKELIDQIYSQGYRVNVEIIGTLFLRASQTCDLKMMKYVLSKMRQENLKPNKKLLSHIDDFNTE
uniref:Pentatricopeptide repeat-containing protein 1 n=1 Tax=Lygus hesperus TaxID=30085 RepID=A0A0A9YBF4_LYGHE